MWWAFVAGFCVGGFTATILYLYLARPRKIATGPVQQIKIDVPKGLGHAVGCLEASDNAAELGEDMFEIELHNGIIIDVGWYPGGAVCGEYIIIVAEGMKVIREIHTLDVYQAKQDIEACVREFAEEM